MNAIYKESLKVVREVAASANTTPFVDEFGHATAMPLHNSMHQRRASTAGIVRHAQKHNQIHTSYGEATGGGLRVAQESAQRDMEAPTETTMDGKNKRFHIFTDINHTATTAH